MRARYKLIGDVALVRLRSDDDPDEVVRRLTGKLASLRAILAYEGVTGELRLPKVRLLYGERPVVTTCVENGVVYELDAEQMMFSLGNKFERARVAALVRDWEVVVDSFAGVGQFSVPIAVFGRPKRVHAIELNPTAYEFLVRNVERNGVAARVSTHLGDCREVVGSLEGVADRVVLGYFPGTLRYLDVGLRFLKCCGGVIHLHDLVRKGAEEDYASEVVRAAREEDHTVRVLRMGRVKSYSAKWDHVILDLFCLPMRSPSTR
ncbi:MAG: hypothetical protein NZ988_05965 [Thaumarchaeota archaeon]|nr:hypothetical protein [Candidatus Calditenuaceae archaeon]MDW8187569.1 hypothetical protein [Nitrososphaerota archaeon]